MSKVFSAVRAVIAVAAGKGGVGKSSVTTGLARALREQGYSVGVLDADLYGPSIGRMMPLDKFPVKENDGASAFFPGESSGVKVFSVAHVRSDDASLVARAPVVNELILQCVKDIIWGELDFLLVDFPPGTGDIQLTLLQSIPFAGVVIVTAPSDISVLDVQKTVRMFQAMNVFIAGVIENMSYLPISGMEKSLYPLGKGGGDKLCAMFDIPMIAKVPIDSGLCLSCDRGEDFLLHYKDSIAALAIRDAAARIRSTIFARECLREGV